MELVRYLMGAAAAVAVVFALNANRECQGLRLRQKSAATTISQLEEEKRTAPSDLARRGIESRIREQREAQELASPEAISRAKTTRNTSIAALAALFALAVAGEAYRKSRLEHAHDMQRDDTRGSGTIAHAPPEETEESQEAAPPAEREPGAADYEDVERLRLRKRLTEELIGATESGDYEEVTALLQQGAPVDGRDYENRTPLMVACKESEARLAALFIELGADCEARDDEGKTPLIHAAYADDLACVKLMLEQGVDVDAKDSDEQGALVYAEEIPVLAALLDAGSDIEISDYSGETPLAIAARTGEDKKVEFLLERGADPAARNDEGLTPLDLALEENEEIVVALLRAKQSGNRA